MTDWSLSERFAAWIFGGRPMKRIEFRFHDMISGKRVYLWQDLYGRYWLANTSTSWFRVEAPYPPGHATATQDRGKV